MNVLFKDHARGAMQLTHHDALSTVDDKGAQLRKKRQVTEIDFLLDDVLDDPIFDRDRLFLLFLLLLEFRLFYFRLLEDDKSKRRLERSRIRHVPLNAFLYGILRLTQP